MTYFLINYFFKLETGILFEMSAIFIMPVFSRICYLRGIWVMIALLTVSLSLHLIALFILKEVSDSEPTSPDSSAKH